VNDRPKAFGELLCRMTGGMTDVLQSFSFREQTSTEELVLKIKSEKYMLLPVSSWTRLEKAGMS